MAHLGDVDQQGTHRLIPAAYATESVLETLPLPADVISDLTELDGATNERKIAERGGNAAISPGELLYGVPEAHIVNAAFTRPGPFGGRFNDSRRGAWYAGVELETSIHEVAFHKRRFLKDGRISERLSFDYADYGIRPPHLLVALPASKEVKIEFRIKARSPGAPQGPTPTATPTGPSMWEDFFNKVLK